MINGKFILIITAVFFSFSACKKEKTQRSLEIESNNELKVIVESDFPGYFNLENKSYGYMYEILNDYSEYIGVPIKIEYSNNPTDVLQSSKAHMMAFLSDNSTPVPYAVELFETGYVVLASKKRFRADRSIFSIENLSTDEKINVLISADFKTSDDYDKLLDKQGVNPIFIDHREPLKMAQALALGEYDYMICEKSEAQLICSMIKNVRKVYDFDSASSVNIVMSNESLPLLYDFNRWFSEYKRGNEYMSLKHLYMESEYVGQQLTKSDNHSAESISIYDDLMKKVALEIGCDWRLLAAVAYNESRFNPHVISPMGAKGLMQIMPIVARQFDVDQSEVMEIDVNIMLAAKLIDKMASMLKIPSSTSETDRLKILMAGYNAGVGHVLDAMRLAKKYGDNPNSWNDISFYLQNKTTDKYATDDVVKSGAFRGSKETLAYVEKVYNKYNQYCDVVIN